MAQSIVKAPLNADSRDYDFLAFSFNGKHSYDDFGIYRVSDGDRYNTELTPQMNDKTVDNAGGDGTFFFGTTHKQKVFNVNFAFDHMDDETLRKMKQWLNGKEIHDLWFDEEPYKVYSAKVTGTATMKHIAFEEDGKRIYKGEGTIQFTAYWPYAHTPDYVRTNYVYIPSYFQYVNFVDPIPKNYTISIQGYFSGGLRFLTLDSSGQTQAILVQNSSSDYTEITVNTNNNNFIAISPAGESIEVKIRTKIKDAPDQQYKPVYCDLPGKYSDSYTTFKTIDQGFLEQNLSPDEDYYQKGENYGDLPAPFLLSCSSNITSETVFAVGDLEITVPATGDNPLKELEWDGRTGTVSAKIGNSTKRVPISYTGNSLGDIPIDGVDNKWGIKNSDGTYNTSNITLNYHYWYY